MAETQTNTALKVQHWDSDFFKEYVRDNRFKRYMGKSENSVIQVKEEMTGKKGNKITIPLVTRLTQAAITGNGVLEGNEEQLGNYGWDVELDYKRYGVLVTDREQKFNAIDLRNAAKTMLKTRAMEELRDDVIDAFGAVYNGTSYLNYADASEGIKDTWLTNNSDRLLFGAAKSNLSAADHSASLANIDATTDTLSASIVSLAKRMAKTADPHIRPIRTKEDEEWFVLFANSLAFRDLKTDSTFQQANREARNRGLDNPLFRDGDLVYDGVIIREVPEIAVIEDVGAATIDVAPNYFCGAQSVAVCWGQRPVSKTNVTDYEFRKGVGIQEMRGVEKMFFNNVQHGLLTLYTAGVADG